MNVSSILSAVPNNIKENAPRRMMKFRAKNCCTCTKTAAENRDNLQNSVLRNASISDRMCVIQIIHEVVKLQQLIERIKRDGVVKPGGVLKVDSFLNHQIDPKLSYDMAREIHRLFENEDVNKILTIEASGIGIACIVAKYFDAPVVFAKKSKSINIDGEMYVAEVESFTHKCKNQVIVSKKFLGPDDHVLIIDDFLANGCALQGLISIVSNAGGTVEGIGIAIEKGFQSGGRTIRNLGYHLESLAIVDSMDAENGTITFREQ